VAACCSGLVVVGLWLLPCRPAPAHLDAEAPLPPALGCCLLHWVGRMGGGGERRRCRCGAGDCGVGKGGGWGGWREGLLWCSCCWCCCRNYEADCTATRWTRINHPWHWPNTHALSSAPSLLSVDALDARSALCAIAAAAVAAVPWLAAPPEGVATRLELFPLLRSLKKPIFLQPSEGLFNQHSAFTTVAVLCSFRLQAVLIKASWPTLMSVTAGCSSNGRPGSEIWPWFCSIALHNQLSVAAGDLIRWCYWWTLHVRSYENCAWRGWMSIWEGGGGGGVHEPGTRREPRYRTVQQSRPFCLLQFKCQLLKRSASAQNVWTYGDLLCHVPRSHRPSRRRGFAWLPRLLPYCRR